MEKDRWQKKGEEQIELPCRMREGRSKSGMREGRNKDRNGSEERDGR